MGAAVLQSKTWMPTDYARRLTAPEIENVFAFLSRQSVRLESQSEPPPSRARAEVN